MDQDRVTIQEAARRLGISEGAVRKRVTRGSLEHDKEESGRIYVYLDERTTRGVDDGQDAGVDALVTQLRDEVAFLRDQLRRQQEITVMQAASLRQLSAPPEEPESTIVDQQREEPPASAEGSQAGTQRPWWRFWR